MQITTTPRAHGVVVAPEGRFDAHECPAFREAVTPLIAGGGRIELDLSAVSFLDSTALAELVRARKRSRSQGGDTVVVALSDPVRIILELTGLAEALSTPAAAGKPA
jgi:anti-sigma B factor antagonist